MEIIFVELDGRKWRVEIVNGRTITDIQIVKGIFEEYSGGKVRVAEVF